MERMWGVVAIFATFPHDLNGSIFSEASNRCLIKGFGTKLLKLTLRYKNYKPSVSASANNRSTSNKLQDATYFWSFQSYHYRHCPRASRHKTFPLHKARKRLRLKWHRPASRWPTWPPMRLTAIRSDAATPCGRFPECSSKVRGGGQNFGA